MCIRYAYTTNRYLAISYHLEREAYRIFSCGHYLSAPYRSAILSDRSHYETRPPPIFQGPCTHLHQFAIRNFFCYPRAELFTLLIQGTGIQNWLRPFFTTENHHEITHHRCFPFFIQCYDSFFGKLLQRQFHHSYRTFNDLVTCRYNSLCC